MSYPVDFLASLPSLVSLVVLMFCPSAAISSLFDRGINLMVPASSSGRLQSARLEVQESLQPLPLKQVFL